MKKNITTEHLVETALGGYAAVNGGLVFFAFDFLRLSDVFIGHFSQRRLRHSIVQRHRASVRPAFVSLKSQIDGAWGHEAIRFGRYYGGYHPGMTWEIIKVGPAKHGRNLLRLILRWVRLRGLVILNPNQIPPIDPAVACLASEKNVQPHVV